jgi:hypothetical protein
VVWLDSRKQIHYFKQQKRYAQGSTSFVCRDAARSNDYRRSLLGLRRSTNLGPNSDLEQARGSQASRE